MLLGILFVTLLVQTHTFTITINHSHIGTQLTTTAIHSKKPKKGRNATSSGGGKGFGKSDKSNIKVRQTYGLTQQPKDAFIDVEAAMGNFFRSKEEWHPLFASVASDGDVPASQFLEAEGINQDLIFREDTPWQKLPQVPGGDNKDELMAIIAKVLDSSQQALIEIPVNEALKEDENDLHFIEEGRRILCLNRFQVLTTDEYLSFSSTLERHDKIFSLVWSEIYHLIKEDVADSGCLIILPELYDIADLKQFTDLNVLRPLEWLGVESNVLEVASLQRDSPCIRLLHKLSDIPSLETRDQQLEEAGED